MNIHQACFKGTIPAIQGILKENPEAVNDVTEMMVGDKLFKLTPIFFAAIGGMWSAVRHLMDFKAEMEISGGPNLLLWALQCPRANKRYKVISVLCEDETIRRKLIDSIWNKSLTKLHIQRVRIDAALTANDYQQRCQLTFPTTTLDYYLFAGQLGDLDYVKKILDEDCDSEKETLVALGAAMRGHVHILKYLHEERNNEFFDSVDDKESPYYGWTPAFGATWYDRSEALEYLLVIQNIYRFAVPLPKKDHSAFSGWTLAFAAASRGNLNCLKILHSHDIDLTEQLDPWYMHDEYGDYGEWTPIHIATKNKKYDVVKYLLEIGVNVKYAIKDHAKFKPGYAPVHLAAEQCNLDLIKLLDQYGADLSALVRDRDGTDKTVAYLAVQAIKYAPEARQKEYLPFFQYLAFDPDEISRLSECLQNWVNKTSLNLALYLRRSADVARLLKHGREEPPPLIGLALKDTLLLGCRFHGIQNSPSKDQKVIEILKMLLAHKAINRKAILDAVVGIPRVYYGVLTPTEAKIARLSTEAELIRKIVLHKITLAEGYALVIQRGDAATMVDAAAFPHYMEEKIHIILSKINKDELIHDWLVKQFEGLIPQSETPGYATPISKRKMSTIVKLVSDLESVSSELLSFTNVDLDQPAPTVHAVKNSAAIPDDGLELEIQTQLKRAEMIDQTASDHKRLKQGV